LAGNGPKDLGWEISPVQLPGGRLASLDDEEPPPAHLEARTNELTGNAMHVLETVGFAFFARVAAAQGINLIVPPAQDKPHDPD
jgi:hypothetical protein